MTGDDCDPRLDRQSSPVSSVSPPILRRSGSRSLRKPQVTTKAFFFCLFCYEMEEAEEQFVELSCTRGRWSLGVDWNRSILFLSVHCMVAYP